MLIGATMFHGCVAYAIDSASRGWAGGSGATAQEASTDASRKLATPPESPRRVRTLHFVVKGEGEVHVYTSVQQLSARAA